MMSKTIAAALLAGGCVTAAAGGAYLAARHNAAELPAATATTPEAVAPDTRPAAVTETEAPIAPPAGVERQDAVPVPAAQPQAAPPAPAVRPDPPRRGPVRNARQEAAPTPLPRETPAPEPVPVAEAAAPWVPPAQPDTRPYEPPPPPEPQFEEVVIPAASVIGLQVETPLSSERTRVEDRVEARVTRDVLAGGRVAIPAGSRVIGAVTLVERGGKVKERARLGVRFHTVVLAGGYQVPLRTETILREGDPPSSESARKIGGAAAGGAILGAILGGGKGAAIGGAAGAGAGTAAVMAGDRNAATLPAGTIVTARLSGPVVVELER